MISPRRLATYLLCFGAFLVVLPILLGQGWYHNDDVVRYPSLSAAFAQSMLEGHIPPRWLPSLNGGYGYPTFVFYQPAYFLLALPFVLAFGALKGTLATLYVITLMGLSGAYRLARRYGTRPESLLFTLLYFMTPYVWKDFYRRGDFSEFFAMMLCTWAIWAFLRLKDRIQAGQPAIGASVAFALSLFLVVISHPFVALFLAQVLVFVIPASCVGMKRGKALLLYSAYAAALALAGSAFYWVPLVTMRHLVQYRNAIIGWSCTRINIYSLYVLVIFTAPHCVAALAGFWAGRRSMVNRTLLALYLFGLFAMSSYSGYFWEHYRALDFIQFPWRYFSMTALIQYLLMLELIRLKPRIPRPAYATLLYFLVFTASILCWYSFHIDTDDYEVMKRLWEAPRPFVTFTEQNEFDPVTFNRARLRPRTGPLCHWQDGGMDSLSVAATGEALPDCRVDLKTLPPGGRTLILDQAWLPGWELTDNGLEIGQNPTAPVSHGIDLNGRMAVTFHAPGQHVVHVDYDGPPGWQWRDAATVIALLALAGIGVMARRKS